MCRCHIVLGMHASERQYGKDTIQGTECAENAQGTLELVVDRCHGTDPILIYTIGCGHMYTGLYGYFV